MAGSPGDPRRILLLALYRAALAAVDGRARVRTALAGDDRPDSVSAFAVGKAAVGMMQGAIDALGSRLARGLVVAPKGEFPRMLRERHGMRCLEGGHPRPDEQSLAAGRALLEFASATPSGGRVLLLVSGGASSLLEVPAPGVTLAMLRALYDRALAERLDIESLNARRSALSLVKGGRLSGLFRGAAIDALMISDVPHDDPEVLASGLLAAPGLRPVLVGSLDEALAAVLREARALGIDARPGGARLDGDAEEAARRVCDALAAAPCDLLAFGGETVVRLPEHPGRGGRCQHLALAAARRIAGRRELLVLAAATDGRDGASDDAGAIVDGETIERAANGGFDAAHALAAADSGRCLEASGDLLHTGDTGTNVGDVVLALRRRPTAATPM